jgi:hypothetical protein
MPGLIQEKGRKLAMDPVAMLWREFKHDLPTADELKCIKITTRLGGVRVVSADLNYLAQHEHSLTTKEQIKAAGHIAERDFNETAEALQEHYFDAQQTIIMYE